MRGLFISFPAADYELSKQFYEQVIRLSVKREFEGKPHRFTNYDIGGITLKVYEWVEEYHGSGHSGLFIETAYLDDVVERVKNYAAKTNSNVTGSTHVDKIVTHEWGGRCCSITDPFGNIFDLIDENQIGDS